jgi:diadenosine tetraphosphate (Ap4A) HIT family hydrolase/8-oxo-dGTP pyrophosphatase MutT (NUDIX family)
MQLTPEEQKQQETYRDARFTKIYDGIWKSVGKCVFCDLREKYIFFEENGVVMTISLYAYIDGHFMIIPRRHIRSAKELTQLEWETIRKFTYIAKKLIREVHGVRGMQVVQKDGADAQSTVDQHLHYHCIPFDAPDLVEWNFRKLKYTPLENVALYKDAGKKIVELDRKYEKKYTNDTAMRVVCDAVILNEKNEVLLQERHEHLKLHPDYLTLPGGGVDDFSVSLELELAREIKEEAGLDVDVKDLTLLDSRIGGTNNTRIEPHLGVKYHTPSRFLWNTYLLNIKSDTPLQAGDDCSELVWIDVHEALEHDRVSPGIRDILRKVQK